MIEFLVAYGLTIMIPKWSLDYQERGVNRVIREDEKRREKLKE